MKTKSLKTLQLKKIAIAELNKQSSESLKGGLTTDSIASLFCNSIIAGEDYRVCGGTNIQ
ncbi:class I lanthipeptide [Ascidiimonas sp. W6]|uniref:class I lanthipeptide n=1 Tax=Ascidiimonas meishanensis TaxID=3128903 RepID=UPI0030EBCF34